MNRRLDIKPGAGHLLFGLLIGGILALGVGCDENNSIPAEQAEPFVAQWSGSVEETLREMAVAPAGKQSFKARLEKARAAEEKKTQRDAAPYDVFVDEVYQERDYKFSLVGPAGLTERGEAVWDVLKRVDEQAVDPSSYALSEIEAELSKLAEANTRFEALASFETSDAERAEALKWVGEQPADAFELSADNYEALTQAVLESDSSERMKQRLADYESVSKGMADIEAHIEQLLARDVVRYAAEMKHFRIRDVFIHRKNFDRWNTTSTNERRPLKARAAWEAQTVWRTAGLITDTIAEANQTELLYERTRQTLRDVLGADAAATMADLLPQHPQYAKLQKEYLRYRAIVDKGGWEEVEPVNALRKGQSHATAQKLKKRLQIEGYYPADAPVDSKYDEALEAAISAYQTTHQMEVSGTPHRGFWGSLNISAQRRMEQLALNMERWRASNIRHADDLYVYINIPDFTVEVWDKQQREMRFGVVVGNNATAIDEETKKSVHVNQTPTMSAYIDRVIYNPYWVVTPRIRADEILPKVRESVEASYQAKIRRLLATKAPAKAAPSTILGRLGSFRSNSEESGTLTSTTAQPGMGQPTIVQPNSGDATSAPAPAPSTSQNAEAYWSVRGDKHVVFDVAALRKLVGGDAAGGEDAVSPLKSQFFYLDPASGTVDVSVTHKDHIPAWYAANEYEVMYPGNLKWEYVRMLPGEKNSLGKVKVIFPNMQDIYLHDTPAKSLFRQDIRSFSHGCIRMEDPLGFAEYLLKRDGRWDEYNVPKILSGDSYDEAIFFKRQIPVHIDYFTARVDDSGRANFLADIYKKDRYDAPDEG